MSSKQRPFLTGLARKWHRNRHGFHYLQSSECGQCRVRENASLLFAKNSNQSFHTNTNTTTRSSSTFLQASSNAPMKKISDHDAEDTNPIPILRNATQQNVVSLMNKSREWLDCPVGEWTMKEVALGRSLLDDWLRLLPTNADRAPWSSKILERWIQECSTGGRTSTSTNDIVSATANELVDMLHRVLFAWRVEALQRQFSNDNHDNNNLAPLDESLFLINQLQTLYQSTRNDQLRPGDKAYSMVLQTMAVYPKHLPQICDEAIELLEKCCIQKQSANSHNDNGASDLIVWNSCLNVLAKSSRHYEDAPKIAEELLNCMMTGSSVLPGNRQTKTIQPPKPDVVSFATVLSALANSRQPGAAQRAQAILERMEQRQHNKNSNVVIPAPNTTCYNICIGAHANSREKGSAQKAQAILDRMQETDNQEARPDHISFLSTMNAWAKCTDNENDDESHRAAEMVENLLEKMQELYVETGDLNLRPTPASYAVVLDAWSRSPESGPKVEAMLYKMEEEISKTEVGDKDDAMRNLGENLPQLKTNNSSVKASYLAAIRAWGNTMNDPAAPERAEKLLRQMESISSTEDRRDLIPCVKTYAETVTAWAKSSRDDAPEHALAVLRSMQDQALIGRNSVQPNAVVFNIVISAFAKKGDAGAAMALLDEMKELHASGNENAKPDAVTYSTVISALAHARHFPQSAHRASELLDELVEQYQRYGQREMQPARPTYTSAILAWSNSGEDDCGERAEEIFQSMLELAEKSCTVSLGLKPNTKVSNAVLRAWSRSPAGGACDKAEDMLQWMRDQVDSGKNVDLKPDIVTYNYVMQTWARSRRAIAVNRIEKHLNQMIREETNIPNVFSYNCLLEAMKNAKRKDRAQQCLLLLEQLLTRSRNSEKRLWNLQSFHLVLLAVIGPTAESEAQDRELLNVVKESFQLLKSIEVPSLHISKWTLELLLRAYWHAGGSDTDFLSEVFLFCYQKTNPVDVRATLASLQQRTSKDFYAQAMKAAQDMQNVLENNYRTTRIN